VEEFFLGVLNYFSSNLNGAFTFVDWDLKGCIEARSHGLKGENRPLITDRTSQNQPHRKASPPTGVMAPNHFIPVPARR